VKYPLEIAAIFLSEHNTTGHSYALQSTHQRLHGHPYLYIFPYGEDSAWGTKYKGSCWTFLIFYAFPYCSFLLTWHFQAKIIYHTLPKGLTQVYHIMHLHTQTP